MGSIEPILMIHGGFVTDESDNEKGKLQAIQEAIRLGYCVFKELDSIHEGALQAVKSLEASPMFQVGRSFALTKEGTVEMEAMVMHGSGLDVGSVCCINHVDHPIDMARLMRARCEHVMLVGKAVNRFAERMEFPINKDLTAQFILRKSQTTQKEEDAMPETVASIGINHWGHTVACSSAGGLRGKMEGTIMGTAVPGVGSYADDEIGVVTVSGNCSSVLRFNLAAKILFEMEDGKTAQKACEDSIKEMSERIGGQAGALAISKNGDVGIYFNTKKMFWAYSRAGKVHYGLNPGEDIEESY